MNQPITPFLAIDPDAIVEIVDLNSGNGIVRTSNDLIDSHFDLSLIQIRLVWLFAKQIKKKDREFHLYKVSIADIVNALGMKRDHRVHEKLEVAFDGLMSQVLHREDERSKPSKPKWEKISFVTYARYDGEEGVVYFRFSEEIKPFLLELEANFTRTLLENLFALSGRYAARLYLILKRYQFKRKFAIPLNELRLLLALDTPLRRGQKEPESPKYGRYPDLRRYVLELSIREINEKTDLKVSYETIRAKRKVVAIQFRVDEKPDEVVKAQVVLPLEAENTVPRPISDMIECGVSAEEAHRIWQKKWEYLGRKERTYIPEDADFEMYVREKIALLRTEQHRKMNGGERIPNPGGWLVKAIKGNWVRDTDLPASKRSKVQKNRTGKLASMSDLLANYGEKNNDPERTRGQSLDEAFDALSKETQIQLNAEVITRLIAMEEFSVFRMQIQAADPARHTAFVELLPAIARPTATKIRRDLTEALGLR